MKSLWISALLFVSVLISQAQEKTEKDPNEFRTRKNELGIGMFNAFALSSNPTPNISYKRYTENGALRVSVGGYANSNNQSRSFQTSDQEVLKDLITNNAMNVGFGYEHHIPMNRWMLFVGGDLIGSYYNRKDEFKSKNTFFYNGLEYTRISENNQNTETIGFGLNTFLGMKFWINDRLSINTQFEARFRQNFTTNDLVNNNIYSISEIEDEFNTTKSTSSSLETRLSPLGLLSFNFHF